jgi:diamine N-acetyltransferase
MSSLRALQMKDIDKMFEWMTDPEVVKSLVIGRYPISKEKVHDFIINSGIDRNNIHFAIVTEDDEYVGTVSLKNINYIDRNAEYAIAIRKNYWGKGYSKIATDLIIEYGFNQLNLNKIYLNVISSNIRANKFYQKYGFEEEGIFKKHMFLDGEYVDLNWYCIFNK